MYFLKFFRSLTGLKNEFAMTVQILSCASYAEIHNKNYVVTNNPRLRNVSSVELFTPHEHCTMLLRSKNYQLSTKSPPQISPLPLFFASTASQRYSSVDFIPMN